jgi:hypothetical protein
MDAPAAARRTARQAPPQLVDPFSLDVAVELEGPYGGPVRHRLSDVRCSGAGENSAHVRDRVFRQPSRYPVHASYRPLGPLKVRWTTSGARLDVPPGMRTEVTWRERTVDLGPGAHVLA